MEQHANNSVKLRHDPSLVCILLWVVTQVVAKKDLTHLVCQSSSTLEATHDAQPDQMGPVPFVRMTLRRTLLSVQCVQDCCYNRMCAS